MGSVQLLNKFQQTNKDPIFELKLMKYWKELEKVAQLNKIELQMYHSQTLKFYIGKGNNSKVLKECMRKRWWWIPAEDKNDKDINLIWLQLKDKFFYQGKRSCSNSSDSELMTSSS